MNRPAANAASAGLWLEGWYRHAHRLDSPNFGPRPVDTPVDLIVIHAISLPPGRYGTGCVQRFFTQQLDWQAHPYFGTIRELRVSAHFFIERTGALWQFVSCSDRAWHAGTSRYRGRDNCNDDSIGIELEGQDGQAFEAEQYETLGSLCSALMQSYPIEHFAGHEHIAPGRKTDPGPGFCWTDLQKSLGLPDPYFPSTQAPEKPEEAPP
ncbi:MAG: 1,6-anhydro-N-acetylmuramyl-L-alanine amidase AmpD [Betaproteobacteria bacterium]|nr:1,6-anhydro-N-acetylmuramyl-L-alanine amidase AmpD [Betaproteobacteria bacterium]